MANKFLSFILTMLLSFLCLSCATSGFTQTGEKYSPYKGIVRVFDSHPENVNYREIGRLSARGDSSRQWTSLIKSIQKKAAKNGANAIIILNNNTELINASVEYSKEKGFSGSADMRKSIQAIAIRIKE